MSDQDSEQSSDPGSVPPVKRTSVGFSDASHQLVRRAAESQGVSLSQYVREAAMARAWFDAAAERGELSRQMRDVYKAIREGDPPPWTPNNTREGESGN